jgi:hypothetical protein
VFINTLIKIAINIVKVAINVTIYLSEKILNLVDIINKNISKGD